MYIEGINEKWRQPFLEALVQIEVCGFDITHRYDNGFPMLIGGTELYARKGDFLMCYSLVNSLLTIAESRDVLINWDIDTFVCKWLETDNLSVDTNRQIYKYERCKGVL